MRTLPAVTGLIFRHGVKSIMPCTWSPQYIAKSCGKAYAKETIGVQRCKTFRDRSVSRNIDKPLSGKCATNRVNEKT